jgi:UDP-GlcNAc:undecaprenyl-phosphate GlcNAc-1-phosphate transferase
MSIFAGGKDHLSHRLLRQHFSKRQSALLLWGISAIFVGMSMKLALMSSGAMLLLYSAVIFWVALLMSFLRCRDE